MSEILLQAAEKPQLSSINANLAATIQDYTIYVHYEPKGIIAPFKEYMLRKMQGTYFQDNTAEVFCSKIAPAMLALWVLGRDCESIVRNSGIGEGVG